MNLKPSPTLLSIAVLIASVSAALVAHPGIVRAMPLTISDTPQENQGPFRHNVFHSASGITSGDVLGWYDLDSSSTSTYDPNTGAVTLHVEVFSNATLTNPIGTAIASGTLPGNSFNSFNQQVIGTISWAITLQTGTSFYNYMQDTFGAEGDDTWDVMMTFLDNNYVTSAAGYTANSWVDGVMTLWGANGYDGEHFTNAKLGTDLVASTVPEPGTLILLGTGFLGLAAYYRKHHRKDP